MQPPDPGWGTFIVVMLVGLTCWIADKLEKRRNKLDKPDFIIYSKRKIYKEVNN